MSMDKKTLDLLVKLASTEEGYDVMTALRGPDFEGHENIKYAITAVLRYHVGISSHNLFGCFAWADTSENVEVRKSLVVPMDNTYGYKGYHHRNTSIVGAYRQYYHFIRHSQKAFEAMGMKWDELNPDPWRKR